MTMTTGPVLADRELMAEDVSAIRELPLAPHWPPPSPSPRVGHEPAAGREPGTADRAGALTAGPDFPRRFATLLAEGLAGARPVRQLAPWLSRRGRAHLDRLLPLFGGGQPHGTGQQPRVVRVLTSRPAPDAVEMTMIMVTGQRTRALAIRLERDTPSGSGADHWLCTDIEAA
jgi:hypothetical protein